MQGRLPDQSRFGVCAVLRTLDTQQNQPLVRKAFARASASACNSLAEHFRFRCSEGIPSEPTGIDLDVRMHMPLDSRHVVPTMSYFDCWGVRFRVETKGRHCSRMTLGNETSDSARIISMAPIRRFGEIGADQSA